MNQHFLDYFRCPDAYANFELTGSLSQDAGYFRWGEDTLCYGRTAGGTRVPQAQSACYDSSADFSIGSSGVRLPFDSEEILENLQRERYSAHFREPGRLTRRMIRKLYYLVRPLLSVPVRKHLQKINLRGWEKIAFPEWPVDCTLDRTQRKLLALAMQSRNVDSIPFIWFWPEDYRSCAIITHDVEARDGRDFCGQMMDMDESFGFHTSFQVVPEVRYPVPRQYLESIASRGFEVNVHDLNHDGRLYADYDEFQRRAKRINHYGREFGAVGFRSGILYRNADWYDAFEFLYDMSIPNVAHLDPQRGGCCTVMPYMIGDMVEVPVTCTQDYTLFHILEDYSIDLWKEQVQRILAQSGLISILVHPDYVIEERARGIYRSLLGYLQGLRETNSIWAPLPREVAQWWKERSQMKLVLKNGKWEIEGAGKERARVAYACLAGDDVTYSLAGETEAALREAGRTC